MEPVIKENTEKNSPSVLPETGRSIKLRFGVSGSTLKMIAVITMLIDHFAAGVLGRYLSIQGAADLDSGNMEVFQQWAVQHADLFSAYAAMRMIGRIAFPIYCFLLVEGFQYTGSKIKYASRLLIFALVSEVPFDLLFNAAPLEVGYQNVFFTLYIGMLAMMGLDWIEQQGMKRIVSILMSFAVIFGCMYGAQCLKTDYGAAGVLCIMAVYLFRRKKGMQILAGCIAFSWELTAPLAFIPIALYNGKRGWNLKYFFYFFYPVHLLLLYLLCMALGTALYPAL